MGIENEVELLKELQELRQLKLRYEADDLHRAFIRLQQLLDAPFQVRADTVMSIRSFRILADALIELKTAFERGLKNGQA